jgi:hypothetical protein
MTYPNKLQNAVEPRCRQAGRGQAERVVSSRPVVGMVIVLVQEMLRGFVGGAGAMFCVRR